MALLLIMTATAAGLFGRGPVSHTVVTSASGRLSAELERFERYGASTRLSIVLDSQPSAAPHIVISSDYLDAIQIQRIVPSPTAERAVEGGIALEFGSVPTGQLAVHIDLQPMRRGWINGEVSAGGETVQWSHFIYP